MSLITPEYLELQTRFHEARPDYGMSGHKHVEPILSLSQQLKSRDILDYGCGKASLQKGLPFPIQNYDPCMPEYERRPQPAVIVVCTDVLEHIEIDCLKDVLDDIRELTKQLLFMNVACRPAKKFLPDGRNAHLLQENPNWWLTWLLPRFHLHSFQVGNGDFTALFFIPPIEPVASNDA